MCQTPTALRAPEPPWHPNTRWAEPNSLRHLLQHGVQVPQVVSSHSPITKHPSRTACRPAPRDTPDPLWPLPCRSFSCWRLLLFVVAASCLRFRGPLLLLPSSWGPSLLPAAHPGGPTLLAADCEESSSSSSSRSTRQQGDLGGLLLQEQGPGHCEQSMQAGKAQMGLQQQDHKQFFFYYKNQKVHG
jgi:hypothetical protein